MKLAIPLFVALACGPAQGLAQSSTSILGTELGSFSVLGASTVTNTGATTIGGNVGVSPGTAITGAGTISITGVFHTTDAFAGLGQSQLTTARTNLTSLGSGLTLGANLSGLTLSPGIYTVPAGVSNLTGTLTLNGQGNANAAWVFQMPSTLITSPGSVVNVTNTGAGAGLFWNVGSSATLDTTTSFQGNVLALASISLNTGATIGCGRALASTGAVTMQGNTIGSGCGAVAGGRSDRLGGGFTVPAGGGKPTLIGGGTPGAGVILASGGSGGGSGGGSTGNVPEPETYAITLAGMALLALLRRRRKAAAA
jgi:hypothetical protein